MTNGLKARTDQRILLRPAATWPALSVGLLLSSFVSHIALAQYADQRPATTETTEQKLQRLTTAVAHAQAQMSAYQKQLQDLQQELVTFQQQVAAEKGGEPAAAAGSPPPAVATSVAASGTSASSLDEIREREAMQDSQIATLDQSKVETESKYPVKVSGLVLFNGFVNTRQVDIAANPTYALTGGGSTGFSVRQTVLGLDARGPHVFGATSHADVRVDFFASGSQSGYDAGGVLRLRTAHGTLDWPNTEAFVELDRPLLSPNQPTSLVATAQPEFAWSGNLWTWNPQVGVSHQIAITESKRLKLQAALIDVADPYSSSTPSSAWPVSQTERSRWPGTEARVAFAADSDGRGLEVGASGYFSPHETTYNLKFDSWAGAVDLRLPIKRHFELTASAYRGEGLGGLGGGGYRDYLYQYVGNVEVARGLDDVGGWTQLKTKVGTRLEFNGGFGIDNPFATEIRAALYVDDNLPYTGLARNRSVFGNVIYSPSTYLLFSLEYRRLWTNYITGSTNSSDVIGVGAGYRF